MRNLILIMIFSGIVLSCNGGGGSGDDSATVDPLIGTWTSDCSGYMGSLEFNSDYSAIITDNGWNDQNCTTKTMSDKISATFSNVGTNVTYTITKHELILHDSTKVTNANNASLCGISNWESGVAQNITGLSCTITDYSSNYDNPVSNGDEWNCEYTINGSQLTSCGGDTYTKQ